MYLGLFPATCPEGDLLLSEMYFKHDLAAQNKMLKWHYWLPYRRVPVGF